MAETASEEHKAVLQRYVEGFNEQDLDALQETVAEDVTVHGLIGVEGPVNDIGEYGEWAMQLFGGIPDAQLQPEEFLVDENKVAVRWSITGTHEGDLFGLPPTNESFEVTGLAIFRMENGKIAEKWYQQDDLGMLQQAGIVERF